MNSPKAIVYDLGVAISAVGLWLTPVDVARAIGYATSIVFSGRAYYTGITLLSKEKKEDEIEAMKYDASVDFHERLLESSMELKLQQLENKFTEYLIPLAARKRQLEQHLDSIFPHPELSEEDRELAARSAIESAFVATESKRSEQITEEDIRKQFPETMDGTSWKAILKALQNGASRDEIVRDVLGCTSSTEKTGKAYFELLKQKYLA